MGNKAQFKFKGTLQDFLSASEKVKGFDFQGNPSVKDAIEAQGIPHVEVKEVHLNKAPVDFDYKLQAGDEVEVFPYLPSHWSHTPDNPMEFIVDCHLGKLTKALRTLGFDCTYDKGMSEQEMADLAKKGNKVVLSRSLHLLKNNKVAYGYWLRSQDPDEQVLEVLNYYGLRNQIKPFSRCRICNGLIDTIEKEKITDQLPALTRAHFHEFFQCEDCHKVYWKGSHFEKMEIFIKELKKNDHL